MGEPSQEVLAELEALTQSGTPGPLARQGALMRRQWRVGAGVFTLILALALVLPLTARPLYEASAILLIDVPLEGPDAMMARLQDDALLQRVLAATHVPLRPLQVVDRIRIVTRDAGGVQISVRVQDPAQGTRLIRALAEELLVAYRPRFAQQRDKLRSRREQLAKLSNQINGQLEDLRQAARRVLEQNLDASTYVLLTAVSVRDRVEALLIVQRELQAVELRLASLEPGDVVIDVRRLSPLDPRLQRGLGAIALGVLGGLAAMLAADRAETRRRSAAAAPGSGR